VRPPSDDPELGTIATPTGYRLKVQRPGSPPVPDRLDVLARDQVGPTTLLVVGHVTDGEFCVMQYDDAMSFPFGGAVSCGPANQRSQYPPRGVSLDRMFSADRGPLTYTIGGTAPAGTRAVVVAAPDGRRLRAAVYDSGARWQHAAFFYLPWQQGSATVTALDSADRVLARATSSG
jgi:hypothetical protein